MQHPVGAIPALPSTAAGLLPLYGDPPDGVRANIVLTLDGGAVFDGRTRPISDDTDLWLLNQLRSYADALVVGAGTIAAERYGPVRLTDEQRDQRAAAGYADGSPPIVIVSARAELDPSLPVFVEGGPRPLLATVERSRRTASRLAGLADVIVAGDVRVDPARLLAALAERGLRRVLCEGGPTLLASFVESDLVEDMCLTLAPRFAGPQLVDAIGRPGQPLEGMRQLTRPTRMSLRHVLTHDEMLYLRYTRPSGPASADRPAVSRG